MAAQSTDSTYPLGRDLLASVRLDLQHYHWTSSNGFLLHPSIPLKPNARIADIGCGTGIWSLDLTSKLPSGATIDASDISLAQAPPRGWWPANVTFSKRDIFAPIPDDLVGKYDIVHIRLFMCVVSAGDPLPLLRNLLKLLKPGGYLQWQEYNASSDTIITPDQNLSTPKLAALVSSLRQGTFSPHTNLNTAWTTTLQEKFGGEGADLVEHVITQVPNRQILVRQEMMFLVFREWAEGLKSSDREAAEKLLSLVADAEAECWSIGRGSAVSSQLITWVAKKA